MDHTQTLPDDVLASILRRLLPRGLAASRCVCKAWLAVVDTDGMLLPHVLPHSVCGLFFNYVDYHRLHFFARPSPRLPINGNLNFLPHYHYHFNTILDHCNGLLLCDDAWSTRCVVNPATRQWDNLPWEYENANPHLVFDPTISPHYEVFSIPRVPNKIVPNSPPQVPQRLTESGNLKQSSWSHVVEDGSTESTSKEHKQKSDILSCFEPPLIDTRGEHEDPTEDLMEWPPYLWGLNVFSSNTRQWHMRSFLRESGAAGTIADARLDLLEPRPSCWGKYGGPRRRYSAYWKGSLYVHCHGAFVVRLSLSDCKYQVIQAPIDTKKTNYPQFLGKSEMGVYLATLHNNYQLRVWTLTESSRWTHWVLKHHVDLEPLTMVDLHGIRVFDNTWTIVDDDNVHYYDFDDD